MSEKKSHGAIPIPRLNSFVNGKIRVIRKMNIFISIHLFFFKKNQQANKQHNIVVGIAYRRFPELFRFC